VGTAFAIVSAVKGSDAASRAAALGAGGCANPSAPGCSDLHASLVGHDTFAKAAVGTFVFAGAVGAATLIYTFAVPRAPAAAKAVQVVPVVGPGAGALTVRGSL
jgi:hypothetical protein